MTKVYSIDGITPVVHPSAYVHPSAVLIGDVIVGPGVYIGPLASLRGDFGRIVVEKGARGGITSADTRVVEGDARVIEVARLLGGDPESDVSLAHARELLSAAAHDRESAEPPKRSARKLAKKR